MASETASLSDLKSGQSDELSTNQVKRALVMLYDNKSATNILAGLKMASSRERQLSIEQQEQTISTERSGSGRSAEMQTYLQNVSDKMSCSMCGIVFDSRNDQSDWHRHNLHLKIKSRAPISEADFEQMTDDVSSISGSDTESTSSSDSEQELIDLEQTNDALLKCGSNKDPSFYGEHCRLEKLYFRNSIGDLISVHRCAVYGKKNQPASSSALLQLVQSMPQNMHWAVFMAGGGHFAAAVFDQDTVLVHKTFHRYVVRAKAGTAQSSRDSQGNAPKSGGATLRRYNEAALTQEIRNLIATWSDELGKCSRIFLRAPSFNRAIFFGGKTPALDKNDPRINSISLRTRRPTLNEVKRVHKTLATVECHGKFDSLEDFVRTSPRKQFDPSEIKMAAVPAANAPRSDSVAPRGLSEVEGEDTSSDEAEVILTLEETTLDTLHLREYESSVKPRRRKKPARRTPPPMTIPATESRPEVEAHEHQQILDVLYTACKTGDVDLLQRHLEKLIADSVLSLPTSDSPSIPGEPASSNDSNEALRSESFRSIPLSHEAFLSNVVCSRFGQPATTLLHTAARAGHKACVRVLLERGADPAIKDGQKQYAYVLASNKETKNEFRKFMALFPDKYDYGKAQIPGPLTSDMELEKKTKMAEKKKIQLKAKKEKQKEEKLEEMKRVEEEKGRQQFLALSDREKRAMAAEQRLQLQLKNPASACRCWQCGADMVGKVPFEYYDYKFCTPACLKSHKLGATKTS